MTKDNIRLITEWTWQDGRFTFHISRIEGGRMPDGVRQQLAAHNFGGFGPETSWSQLGRNVVDSLARFLPEPEDIDLGVSRAEGVVSKVLRIHSSPATSGFTVGMDYRVSYVGEAYQVKTSVWPSGDLDHLTRRTVEQLHREVNQRAREWFAETYGGGSVDPTRWRAQKTEVFISYRESGAEIAEMLFQALGEYRDRTLFTPRIDRVDMQSGSWMDQLMEMIERCQVFIPVLSHDYLEGPISRPELDQALREHFSKKRGKRIIPILSEGEYDDYRNHFIGGFHIVDGRKGIDDDKAEAIAHLALGVSRNPYE